MSNDDQHEPYDPYSTLGGTRQTRTRLPEAPGDAHGAQRRPARSSRGLVTVVGVVVLLIAAIAFANQSGDDSSDSGGEGNTPGPSQTAASGVRPVDGKNNGIPSGFAQNEQGAQSAATNFAVALGSDGMFDPARRQAIANAVYVPEVAAANQAELERQYSDPGTLSRIGLDANGKAPKGQTFISRMIPVGSTLDKFGGDTATVSVWQSSLFGLAGEGSKNPVSESWYTVTYELRWVNGDWRLVSFAQKDGPAPVGRDQTAATAEEMAGAVSQFGGFTYAR
ncbi:hypothetical protein [Streptomyces sp. NPDC048603]|uniref:hypothetical protein n=1 Tax=Streptomyces sp. NPDC048603 TaxID=3365577 RepID=UPI00371E6CFD